MTEFCKTILFPATDLGRLGHALVEDNVTCALPSHKGTRAPTEFYTVQVVSSEFRLRSALATTLPAQGFHVSTVHPDEFDPDHAERAADVLLFDRGDDPKPARAFCKGLAARKRTDLAVFFVGAPPSREEELLDLRAGALGHFGTPVVPEILTQTIQNHLAARRPARHTNQFRRAAEFKDILHRLVETAGLLIPIRVQLEKILDILGELSWLEAQRRGAIFLVDHAGDLTIVASRGVQDLVLEGCTHLPAETCICGRVAASGRATYIAHTSKLAGYCGQAGEDQGLYVIPLNHQGNTLGVLLLFVKPGRTPDGEEAAFVEQLATCVSALVSRRSMEAVVEVRNYEIQAAQVNVLKLLELAGKCRDNETGLHVLRVAQYSRCIAECAGLSEAESDLLFEAAPLHDIGKVGIPDAILRKPAKLTSAEFTEMQMHTLIGERILHGDNELITMARTIAGSHHERWDGGGYPRRLAGTDIPIAGRICAIADVFDALGHARPYKSAWELPDVLDYIRQKAGQQFDPMLVEAFFHALPNILRFRVLYSEATSSPERPYHLGAVAPTKQVAYPWIREYSVGLGAIDEHHRYLFDLVNELHEALADGASPVATAKALKALESYTRVHFCEEERLMMASGYPGLAIHQQQHAEFVAQIGRTWDLLRNSPLVAGQRIMKYLTEWLVRHIQDSDRRAAAFLRPDSAARSC